MKNKDKTKYVVCINNEGYPASLELRKIYEALPDEESEKHDFLRIIDESGEDYLFPAGFFLPIKVPEAITHAFARAS